MFTGIIKAIGRVADMQTLGSDARVRIETGTIDCSGWEEGASIAVNGVCLTAVEIGRGEFTADVSAQTLAVTTFGSLGAGSFVNLEPALRIGDALDGHWVTGHVDGIATVLEVIEESRSIRLRFAVPASLARYLAYKGSIAVDGVSLTVNAVDGEAFEVTIIPHTRSATIVQHYVVGTAVNIEVDIVARYLERLAPQTT